MNDLFQYFEYNKRKNDSNYERFKSNYNVIIMERTIYKHYVMPFFDIQFLRKEKKERSVYSHRKSHSLRVLIRVIYYVVFDNE